MTARPQVWVTELAARFWALVGDPPPFPRDLREAVSWLRPVHFLEVPHLTLTRAEEHLARLNIRCPFRGRDRALAGCFAGERGFAAILIDATLDPAEARFTLAHELAHYLRDYDAPRRKVAARLGAGVLEVLDGLRPATADERLAGVLRGVTVGASAHALDRDRWGRVITSEAWEAEAAADRLALELLAPFDAVGPRVTPDRAALVARLTSDFGLPHVQADRYATLLLR